MCDDLTEQAIGCYGYPYNHTPAMDRLASEGVRFTHAFVTNSICGPSRAVLLTGKHNHLNGFINNDLSVFDSSQQTFPKLLRKNGYQTAIIGKWHLASEPTGFNYWRILPRQGHYYNPEFINNGIREKHDGYVTELITDFALQWLEQERDTTKPFCLMVHHKAPHRNWMASEKYLNAYDTVDFPVPSTFFDDYATRGRAAREQKMTVAHDLVPGSDLKLFFPSDTGFKPAGEDGWLNVLSAEQLPVWIHAYDEKNREYLAAKFKGEDLILWRYRRYMQEFLSTVASVDESLQQLMDYLDKAGLTENTLVILTSDQGFYLGEHGWFDKRFMYEPSLKTPLIIRYPDGIRKGWVCESMVQNLDFAETLLDYAGIRIPKEMQGKSMKPLLEERANKIRNDIYYHYYEYPGVHSVKRHYGIRTDRYKLIHFYYDCDEWEFYDLLTDPNELNNCIDNTDYQYVITDLRKRLDKLRKKYKVPEDDEVLKDFLR
jgi:arylsulfatase A-like enzyme